MLMAVAGSNLANAQGLKDILGKLGGGSGASETIGNLLEGVLSKSDLTVSDLVGTWTSTGPAISFKGDNFLKKAGGAAAAATIETKLKPYYEKFGLTGATFEVDKEGAFTLTVKKMKLKGTIEPSENGEKGAFEFKFQAFGKVNLGHITAYVQKTSGKMDVMFDATKLKNIMSAVAQYSNISMAKTVSSLLDSYDGLCVGFALTAVK